MRSLPADDMRRALRLDMDKFSTTRVSVWPSAAYQAFIIRNRFKLKIWQGWDSTQETLGNTLQWLRARNFVDYSILLTEFRVSRKITPGCKFSFYQKNCLLDPRCSEKGKECEVFCFTVIDYLMQYDIGRQLESLVKKRKWHDYSIKTATFFDCLGDLTSEACIEYLKLGCKELFRQGLVSEADLNGNWCMALGTWDVLLPEEVWIEKGCVPDSGWKDNTHNQCSRFAGRFVTIDDFFIRGSQKKTPLQACCIINKGENTYVYATPKMMESGIGRMSFNASERGLQERFWIIHGCNPDPTWTTLEFAETCSDVYAGVRFSDEDLKSVDSTGRSPAEACCLDFQCGEMRYFEAGDVTC